MSNTTLIDATNLSELLLRPMRNKSIRHPKTLYPDLRDPLLSQKLQNGAAKSAIQHMVLHRDEPWHLSQKIQEQLAQEVA